MLVTIVGVGLAAALAGLGWALRRLFAKLDAVQEIRDRVVRIESQVFQNSGHSLRDAVDRTEHRLTDHLIDAATDRAQLQAHIAACALQPTTQVVVQPPPQ